MAAPEVDLLTPRVIGRDAADLRAVKSPNRFDPAIRIVDHDPGWAAQAVELDRIETALGPLALRLEHVGSTAVPGLVAKPIIDLQVSVDTIEPRPRYVEPRERLGYLFAPDPKSPDLHFFAKPPARPRSHHLHVCVRDSHQELRHLAVLDFLRSHADEAANYAALKRKAAGRHPQNRLAYIAAKDRYVSDLEARAVAWAEKEPARVSISRGLVRRPGRGTSTKGGTG
jgi:GrpB-like predicted nucleotidyltransferase (UPF0157 family)